MCDVKDMRRILFKTIIINFSQPLQTSMRISNYYVRGQSTYNLWIFIRGIHTV